MQQATVIKVKTCKEMHGAMPVIRGALSQWADTIDWTVRCDWLQVASVITAVFPVDWIDTVKICRERIP